MNDKNNAVTVAATITILTWGTCDTFLRITNKQQWKVEIHFKGSKTFIFCLGKLILKLSYKCFTINQKHCTVAYLPAHHPIFYPTNVCQIRIKMMLLLQNQHLNEWTICKIVCKYNKNSMELWEQYFVISWSFGYKDQLLACPHYIIAPNIRQLNKEWKSGGCYH